MRNDTAKSWTCLKRTANVPAKFIHPKSGNFIFATSLVWDKNSGCFGNDAFVFGMLKFQGQTVESFWCVLDDLDVWNVSPPNKMQRPHVWNIYRYWSHQFKLWAIHVDTLKIPFPFQAFGNVSLPVNVEVFFFADWVMHKSLSIPDWQYNNWPNVPLNQFHFFGSLF